MDSSLARIEHMPYTMNAINVGALYVCVPAILLMVAPALLRAYDTMRTLYTTLRQPVAARYTMLASECVCFVTRVEYRVRLASRAMRTPTYTKVMLSAHYLLAALL